MCPLIYPDSQRPGKSDLREIAKRILPPLERANSELLKPADELFGAPGSTRDKEDAALNHLEKTGATGTVRSGIIWLAQDNIFNFSGLQMARVILHEALHLVLGFSAPEQDFRYLEEGGVEGLDVDVAVKNADSYVGVVLHSVLDAALMPGQFTLRGE